MAAPLIWLGAGLAALAIADKERRSPKGSQVIHYPGESVMQVSPTDGAVVCCGIYGVFDHTGIWVDGQIIELKGNGLVRAVSPSRFLANRSGERIFVLCDAAGNAIENQRAASIALSKVFTYSEYDVLKNNCHRFCWQCISDERERVTAFTQLNQLLATHYQTRLRWHPIGVA